jgi:hypothetical protein
MTEDITNSRRIYGWDVAERDEFMEELENAESDEALEKSVCDLRDLDECMELPMHIKMYRMVEIMQCVMACTGDERTIIDEPLAVINTMTFKQINCGVQSVPPLDFLDYIEGIPYDWIGTVNGGFIKLSTEYGDDIITINISIRSGTARHSVVPRLSA